MNDCIFCKIINREIPADIVYEDEHAIAFLDIKGVHPGHTLLVPKKHLENIYAFDDITASKIFSVIPKIARAIKTSLQSDGINIGMNNETAAGQVVFHAHIHIMPRYKNDGYQLWQGKPVDPEQAKTIAKQISQHI
jgi:histidine triad (HIT) family protein